MRGAAWRALVVGALALMLAVPVGSALGPALSVPMPGSGDRPVVDEVAGEACATPVVCGALLYDQVRWMETAPLARIESEARHQTPEPEAPLQLAPDRISGYLALGDAEKRAAWQVWVILENIGQPLAPPTLSAPAQPEPPEGPGEAVEVDPLGEPRGLRGLWSLERHGTPSEVFSAGAGGATFLVTTLGVLRFETPGASPTWMVKPGGTIRHTETTDANGDDVPDVVVSAYGWYTEDGPSLTVIDGVTGAVLHRALPGDERMGYWTLTDVDGDGVDEVLGINAKGLLAAVELDGTPVYETELTQLPQFSQFLPVAYAWLMYATPYTSSFGDADGDGIKDYYTSSFYWLLMYVFPVVGEYASVNFAAVYSGADGTELWFRPVSAALGLTYLAPRAVGDVDGDGMDDVLFIGAQYEFVGTFPLFVLLYKMDTLVLAGATGDVIVRDTAVQATACALLCVPLPLAVGTFSTADYLHDLDGDGKAEIIDIASSYGEDGVTRTVIGRVPTVPGGPSTEAYRHDLETGAFDSTYIQSIRPRDIDGDGAVELLMLTASEAWDEDYENMTDLATHVFTVSADGAPGYRTKELLGAWDIDLATGTAYGWAVAGDRWAPIDDEGRTIGKGLRLVVSLSAEEIADKNGDGVPDLLLPKTIGLMWVDGTSGSLLEDIVRPASTYTVGVYENAGRLALYEYDMSGRDYRLLDLATQDVLWQVDYRDDERYYESGVVDVTGDGNLDVIYRKWDWTGDEDKQYVRVFDPTNNAMVLERDLGSQVEAHFTDVLKGRPGSEMLLWDQDQETGAVSLALIVPPEETPRWTIDLPTDADVLEADSGYIILSVEQEGEVIQVLSGATGETVYEYALPADGYITNLELMRVDKDSFPELVFSFTEDYDVECWDDGPCAVPSNQDDEHQFMILDFAKDALVAQFNLTQDDGDGGQVFYGEPDYYGSPGFGYDIGYAYYVFGGAHATTDVGDWNADGLVDFAFREAGMPVVRSTADGAILAVGPARGSFTYSPDLNKDGRPEVGLVTDTGRLRFFTYDDGIEVVEVEEEVRVIENPEVPQTEDEQFFNDLEREAPMPPIVLLIAVMSLLAVVVRRRS